MSRLAITYSKLIYSILIVFLSAGCGRDGGDEGKPEEPTKPQEKIILKEKAKFGVGAAVKTAELKDVYSATVKEHFSQVTGEFEMKMEVIWSGENSYNWEKADALVDYASANGLKVHGHVLVWYKSFPNWFKNANYDSAAFENKVKLYIETVVGRYKGKVISWDVANEVFNDNGTLRSVDCPVYKTFKDPIAFYGRCFRYARNADPAAKLFYNDYNLATLQSKRYYMKQMVSRFVQDGYPIDGLGDQFHYSVNTDMTTIRTGLTDMAATGKLIHLSELDLKVNLNKSDSYVFSPAEQQTQSLAYQRVVEAFESLPQAQKFAITTWGVSDKSTWLTGFWHPKEYPLLFDASFQKKPAYQGFLNGLK